MKIVVNRCYGGFSLSKAAFERYKELSEVPLEHDGSIGRDDPCLIQVIEEMGSDANGSFAKLSIVEIPDDVEWQIEEYDGMEWVAEKHRTWS